MRTISVTLENRNLKMLAKALESMSLKVFENVANNTLRFEGVNTETGQYLTGSYDGQRLTTSAPLDLNSVKRAYARQEIAKQFTNLGKIQKMSSTVYRVQLKA